jgi:hypothetical protein
VTRLLGPNGQSGQAHRPTAPQWVDESHGLLPVGDTPTATEEPGRQTRKERVDIAAIAESPLHRQSLDAACRELAP